MIPGGSGRFIPRSPGWSGWFSEVWFEYHFALSPPTDLDFVNEMCGDVGDYQASRYYKIRAHFQRGDLWSNRWTCGPDCVSNTVLQRMLESNWVPGEVVQHVSDCPTSLWNGEGSEIVFPKPSFDSWAIRFARSIFRNYSVIHSVRLVEWFAVVECQGKHFSWILKRCSTLLVWHEGFLYSLSETGCLSDCYVPSVVSFLKERTFFMETDSVPLSEKRITTGVPQIMFFAPCFLYLHEWRVEGAWSPVVTASRQCSGFSCRSKRRHCGP